MSKSCRDSETGARTGSYAHAGGWCLESYARENDSGGTIQRYRLKNQFTKRKKRYTFIKKYIFLFYFMSENPPILILSGPSGVGKTTVWETLCARYADRLEKIVTTTTRPKRDGEIEGKHYYFFSCNTFEACIDSGDMIEYALVHGNYYGSTLAELERITKLGKYPFYIIDPQGMVHLKPLLQHRGYTVQTFFLLPPSIEELRLRLSGR